MSKKNKTPVEKKITKKSVPFDQVDIEASPELGISFDRYEYPSGTRSKRKLDNMNK